MATLTIRFDDIEADDIEGINNVLADYGVLANHWDVKK